MTNKKSVLFILMTIFLVNCQNGGNNKSEHIDADVSLSKIVNWEIETSMDLPNPRFFGIVNGDELVVTDNSINTINHFNKDGELIQVLGGEGRGPAEFGDIVATAFNQDGRVAIADPQSARITIFDLNSDSLQMEDYDVGWNTHLQWVKDGIVITNYPFRIGATHPGDILMRLLNPNDGTKEEFMHLELEMEDPPFEQISCTFCSFRFLDDLSFYTTPQDTSYRIFKVDPQKGDEILFSRSLPAVELSEEELEELKRKREEASVATGISAGEIERTHKRRFITYFSDEQNRLWALLDTESDNPLRFDLFSAENREYIGSFNAPEQTQTAQYVSGGKILIKFVTDDPEKFNAALFEIVEK